MNPMNGYEEVLNLWFELEMLRHFVTEMMEIESKYSDGQIAEMAERARKKSREFMKSRYPNIPMVFKSHDTQEVVEAYKPETEKECVIKGDG